jgi:hypothetical protein
MAAIWASSSAIRRFFAAILIRISRISHGLASRGSKSWSLQLVMPSQECFSTLRIDTLSPFHTFAMHFEGKLLTVPGLSRVPLATSRRRWALRILTLGSLLVGGVYEGVNPAVYEEVNQMVYVEGLEEPLWRVLLM